MQFLVFYALCMSVHGYIHNNYRAKKCKSNNTNQKKFFVMLILLLFGK